MFKYWEETHNNLQSKKRESMNVSSNPPPPQKLHMKMGVPSFSFLDRPPSRHKSPEPQKRLTNIPKARHGTYRLDSPRRSSDDDIHRISWIRPKTEVRKKRPNRQKGKFETSGGHPIDPVFLLENGAHKVTERMKTLTSWGRPPISPFRSL